MKKILGLVAAAATALGLSLSVQATPIAAGSQFNINGCDHAITASTLDQATGLDFTDCTGVPTPGVPGVITGFNGSGDFTGLFCAGVCGSIQDIPNFAAFVPTPGFYTTTAGVTFDLMTITSIQRFPASGGSLAQLVINGTGLLHYAGFDTTPGVFTLTTQGGIVTTFSASTVTTAVLPEPSTLLLLGVSLLGFALTRRSRS